jgi:hypothetical protein
MRNVPIEGGPVELVGALDLERSATGITPRRLPAWTRPQIPDPIMDTVVAVPSGVRLRFTTDATSIELGVMQSMFRSPDELLVPSTFDLTVDGELKGQVRTTVGNVLTVDLRDPSGASFEPGEPTTVRFEGLAPGTKVVELWLPQRAGVELRHLQIDDDATVAPAPAGRRWVHYGSSISHCIEADSPTTTWPAVAARLGGVDLLSLGIAGQCHLDPFVARTIRDLPADVISLKVGINLVNADSMRERTFGPALHGFLDTIRDGHPTTPVLVVSPILCPSAEDRPGPTVPGPDGRFTTVGGFEEHRFTCLTLTKIRSAVDGIVRARRDLGDANLHHLDGLSLLGPDDAAFLEDGLHPNAEGYVCMGERFAHLAFGPGAALHPDR